MSRYFNDFGDMHGESLEHGFGERAHKYIDKVKTKSGKWRYIYKKKMGEALDKDYEKKLPKGYKKTVKGDTVHYEYKDKDGHDVYEDVKGRGLIRDHSKMTILDVEVGPPKRPKRKKAAPKKVNAKKKKLTPKTGREIAEEAMLAGGSYSLNAKARKQKAKKKKQKKLFNLDDIRKGIY
jgi:hypothetical protein